MAEELTLEHCCICDEHTGRAGIAEDSLFFLDGMLGPLCQECLDQLRQEVAE